MKAPTVYQIEAAGPERGCAVWARTPEEYVSITFADGTEVTYSTPYPSRTLWCLVRIRAMAAIKRERKRRA